PGASATFKEGLRKGCLETIGPRPRLRIWSRSAGDGTEARMAAVPRRHRMSPHPPKAHSSKHQLEAGGVRWRPRSTFPCRHRHSSVRATRLDAANTDVARAKLFPLAVL